MIDMRAEGDRVLLQTFQSRGMAGICLCYRAPLQLARWNSTPLYILIIAVSFHNPSRSENSNFTTDNPLTGRVRACVGPAL